MSDQTIARTRRGAGAGLNVLLGLTLLVLLLVMWLALSVETTTFWTANNIANLLRQGAMIAILAIGETFVIITGGIDLSVGAVDGFISMMVALLLTNDLGFASTIAGAVTISLLIGVVIGLFHAFGVVQMGLPPFIMTLATMYALRGIGLLITNGATISITNDAFTNFSRASLPRLSLDRRELVPDSFPGVDGDPGRRSLLCPSQSQPLGPLSVRDRLEQGGGAALRRQRQGDHLSRLCPVLAVRRLRRRAAGDPNRHRQSDPGPRAENCSRSPRRSSAAPACSARSARSTVR